MKHPIPEGNRPPVWALVLAVVVYAAWVIFLGTLAVWHRVG